MSSKLALHAGALSVALAISAFSGLLGAAHAADEFGTNQEVAAIRAASAPSSAPLGGERARTLQDAFRTGENGAFASPRISPPSSTVAGNFARVAATTPMVGSAPDLVGAGGAQDALARVVHHPGSGTDF